VESCEQLRTELVDGAKGEGQGGEESPVRARGRQRPEPDRDRQGAGATYHAASTERSSHAASRLPPSSIASPPRILTFYSR